VKHTTRALSGPPSTGAAIAMDAKPGILLGGAGTHTRHTEHADAQRHTDHTDEPHNHRNPPTTHTSHVSATTEAAADSTAAGPEPTVHTVHVTSFTANGSFETPRHRTGVHTDAVTNTLIRTDLQSKLKYQIREGQHLAHHTRSQFVLGWVLIVLTNIARVVDDPVST
jgi:hypothetical protein